MHIDSGSKTMDIVSFSRFGYGGEIVKIETDLRKGIPATEIVGLPDGAVRESRERVKAAIINSGFEFPRERILINLSPADLKKEGSAFDLAIALSVLSAKDAGRDGGGLGGAVMVLGELELSGAVRKVRGISSAIAGAVESGIGTFILPEENYAEAEIFPDVKIFPVASLEQAYALLKEGAIGLSEEGEGCEASTASQAARHRQPPEYEIVWPDVQGELGSFDDIAGQGTLIRALEIAAAGGHHVLVYGPPGCGKTMAITRFPTILPLLDAETSAVLTRIRGTAGLAEAASSGAAAGECGMRLAAPFRMPHQNSSLEGMVGGGKHCSPGEISLAHGGVLFLDEAALFRSSVLQALRAPLESGNVTLSRAGRHTTFPARFQLLAAMNPCPCGKFGVAGRICTCAPNMVARYWQQLTEPILDRIDIRVEAALPPAVAEEKKSGGSSVQERLRKSVSCARLRQWERNRDSERQYTGPDWLNAYLTPAEIGRVCVLTGGARAFIKEAASRHKLSGRSIHSLLKVARTIADTDGSEQIAEEHLGEALSLRTWSPNVPDFL